MSVEHYGASLAHTHAESGLDRVQNILAVAERQALFASALVLRVRRGLGCPGKMPGGRVAVHQIEAERKEGGACRLRDVCQHDCHHKQRTQISDGRQQCCR